MKPIRSYYPVVISGLTLCSFLFFECVAAPPEPSQSPAVLNQVGKFISALAQDAEGKIWIGTEDTGVWLYDITDRSYPKVRQFTTKDGLGDNNAYAIACDKLGRIWVGHLNHGVSVYNGKTWKNYGILDGPLGERVFDIAMSPTDGDVWIATSAGLARYSLEKNTWGYYTRAHGLPSDQIQALAVDNRGTIYAGTQCDGLAIGRSSYSGTKWTTVRGPDRMPLQASGKGLPSNQINDILIARDGSVYIATNYGLAIKRKGSTLWNFLRGRDLNDKLKMRYQPTKSKKARRSSSRRTITLSEDYVTCLAEDEKGLIWIGHRITGYELYDPKQKKMVYVMGGKGDRFVSRILAPYGTPSVLGWYGGGITEVSQKALSGAGKTVGLKKRSKSAKGAIVSTFPSPAKLPTAETLKKMFSKVKSLYRSSGKQAVYLGEDWTTQGDWVGRYGRQYTILCAADSPRNHDVAYFDLGYSVRGDMGFHFRGKDSLRHWIHWLKTENPRTLYDPVVGYRRQSEWDDHGEAYPITFEGPDVWITIEIPKGVQQVSFYFFNKDGHHGRNRYRDYLIEIKSYTDDLSKAHFAPVLAQARVRDFWGGVYKKFLMSGPGKYLVRINSNYSFNTIISSVMIDQVKGPPENTRRKYLADMGDVIYNPPRWTVSKSAGAKLQMAQTLWRALDASYDRRGSYSVQKQFRLLAYRAAVSEGASQNLLANWRWNLQIWTEKDRQEFTEKTAKAWQWIVANNPHVFK